MKIFLILVLCVACAVAADLSPGLRVKFSIGLRPGTDFFFDVPRTTAQAILAGWRLTPRPVGPRPSLSLYCHADLTVCVFLDDTGSAAGLQVALDQDHFTDNPFDMNVTGYSEWEVTSSSGQVRKFWTIATYFVSEDYLLLPASEREANRDSSKLLQEDAVWITGFNGTVEKISDQESEIQKSMFTRQSCIPWMGRHYYYDTRKDSECRADTMHPWFLLTDSSKLMAVGLTLIGKYPAKEGKRDWFEHSSRLAVKVIIPRGPECLYNLANNPGRVTMHIYFINRPWTIFCPLFNN